jgi:invasion protein IalB
VLLFTAIFAADASAQQANPPGAPKQLTPPPRQQPQAAPVAPPTHVAQPSATPQPAAAPQVVVPNNGPQRTTATYDDWILQCEMQGSSPPRKVCEMNQLTQFQYQGKTQPFSRAAVQRPPKDQSATLVVQVPVNISFATNVRVQSSDTDAGLATTFARCTPDGCFAEFELKDEALKRFRAETGAGKLSFADSTGRLISVPLSFNGFGKAYEALLKD